MERETKTIPSKSANAVSMRLPDFHTNGTAVSILRILKKLHRQRKNYTVVEWRFPRPFTFSHRERPPQEQERRSFFQGRETHMKHGSIFKIASL